MGTGSHRPQWEAAKGRPDEFGGIKHVRMIRSHTRLKYRPKRDFIVRKEIEPQPSISSCNSRGTPPAESSVVQMESDDSDSDYESMAEELARLRNKQHRSKPLAFWRSESAFSQPTNRSDYEDPFLSKYIR